MIGESFAVDVSATIYGLFVVFIISILLLRYYFKMTFIKSIIYSYIFVNGFMFFMYVISKLIPFGPGILSTIIRHFFSYIIIILSYLGRFKTYINTPITDLLLAALLLPSSLIIRIL